jgi:hypothetical protein
MKKLNLYLTFLVLLAAFFNACGVKKANSYDRFGGGFSRNKPINSSVVKLSEKIPELNEEKYSEVKKANLDNKVGFSAKQPYGIKNIVNDLSEGKSAEINKDKIDFIKNESNINSAKTEKDKPKIMKLAKKLLYISIAILLLGILLMAIFGFALEGVSAAGDLGAVLFALGFLFLIISLLMFIIGGIKMLLTPNSSKINPDVPFTK